MKVRLRRDVTSVLFRQERGPDASPATIDNGGGFDAPPLSPSEENEVGSVIIVADESDFALPVVSDPSFILEGEDIESLEPAEDVLDPASGLESETLSPLEPANVAQTVQQPSHVRTATLGKAVLLNITVTLTGEASSSVTEIAEVACVEDKPFDEIATLREFFSAMTALLARNTGDRSANLISCLKRC